MTVPSSTTPPMTQGPAGSSSSEELSDSDSSAMDQNEILHRRHIGKKHHRGINLMEKPRHGMFLDWYVESNNFIKETYFVYV